MAHTTEPRHWQVQEAKQRFSEVLRAAEADGPQFVTRHGKEIAVIVDIDSWHDYHDKARPDFKEFLASGPPIDELDIRRSSEPARTVDFGD
jgi:prevent-host-death family protein